jgi:hypothetical protein
VNSSVIGKVEKARRYSQERDRMRFTNFSVDFRGDNDDHKVQFADGKWDCTCDFFVAGHGACAHTMALERVLDQMVPVTSATAAVAG